MYETIDIFSQQAERASHFSIEENVLVVRGNLPHLYSFEPKTVGDAKTLINWLHGWVSLHTMEKDGTEKLGAERQKCGECGKWFKPKQSSDSFCSIGCSQEFYWESY